MASSALQARDLRGREGRCVTHAPWEMRKLSAGGEVSVESRAIDASTTAVVPFENPGQAIHRIEVCPAQLPLTSGIGDRSGSRQVKALDVGLARRLDADADQQCIATLCNP